MTGEKQVYHLYMIAKQRIKKYLDKRWKGMIESLTVLSTSADREAIHDLRLHAKKIRTIECLADVRKQHLTAPLKPLIQQSGEIRAAELNLKTFKDFSYNNPKLEMDLLSIIASGYAYISKNNEQYKAGIVSVSRKWEAQLGDVPERKIVAFFAMIIAELSAAFLWVIHERDLHESRKSIKHLLYAHRFLPKSMREKFDLDEEYLDGLQEQIGSWHDLEAAMLLLEQKGLKHEAVYTKIKKAKETLYEQIRRSAKSFRKKVRMESVDTH